MKLFFILISVVLINTSCVHVYYAPSNANSPLLSHKGEARVNGLYTTGWDSEFDGGELQLAYAVTNHFGVMANGFTAGKSEVVSDWEVMGDFGPSPGGHREKGHGSYLELAGSYYKTFQEKFILEAYGGYGFGRVDNDYGSGQTSRNRISKIFVQPAVGCKIRNVEFGVAQRIGLMNWNFKDHYGSLPQDIFSYRVQRLFIFEPSITVRAGFPNVKFQLSMAHTNVLNTNYVNADIESLTIGMGVSINFDALKKRQ